MTLKYESEILFDLMKRDGDDTPSDVLPYESELKEKYLQQVEGAYPKLMDYRPEWLNYNLVAHLPADFPVETVSNVANATFENVVPYAYRSAILTGQTLVNVINKIRFHEQGKHFFYITLNQYELGKNYLFVMFNVPNEITQIYLGNGASTMLWKDYTTDFIRNGSTVLLKVVCPKNYDGSELLPHFKFGDSEPTLNDVKQIKTMLIPYQDGMENWDIPYFEGMASCKMPVLITTGKNLFPKMTYDEFLQNGITVTTGKRLDFYLKPNTKYTLSCNFQKFDSHAFVYFNGTTSTESGVYKDNPITTTTDNTGYLFIHIRTVDNETELGLIPENLFNGTYYLQLEEGSAATANEPYKTNILTVNEEVELRGIGDVKDTLDLTTGELTQRIGEIVLDVSEYWSYSGDHVSNEEYDVYNTKITTPINSSNIGVVDKLAYDREAVSPTVFTKECVYINSAYQMCYVRIKREHGGIVNYLSSNPITIQYQLATESIKTVDLTVTDQDGKTESIIRPIEGTMHLMTEGDAIKPLFSGEIPVEAITQNLASFIEE